MSSEKIKTSRKEDLGKKEFKYAKRKLFKDEETEITVLCKKRRLSQDKKQGNVRNQTVLKCDQSEKNNCEQTKINSAIQGEKIHEKTKNARKKAEINCAVQMYNEENADAQLNEMPLSVFDKMKSSESVSSSYMPIDSVNEPDESSGLDSPKEEPKEKFKTHDSSFHADESTEGMSHQNLNDLKPKQKKRTLEKKRNSKNIKTHIVKNDFKLNKSLENKKKVKRNTIRRNKNLEEELICVSDVECFYNSENADSSEDETTHNSSTSKDDVEYLAFVNGRNFVNKNKQINKNKCTMKKKGGKSDFKMNETNDALSKSINAYLIHLVQVAHTFINKRNKLLSLNILHAEKCLLKKQFRLTSTLTRKRSEVLDLATVMRPEKYEVQKSGASSPEIMNSTFTQLPELLQEYFVVITKSIFYTNRRVFNYMLTNVRQNIAIRRLSSFFFQLTIVGIKKFFSDTFHLERIFDIVIALTENCCFHDYKEQWLKEIINVLLDCLTKHSPILVQCKNSLWSSADLAANFLVKVLRKCETISEEMYDSILLCLETLFQDTSKQLYHYYSALSILIALGPLAVFQVLSKTFLPFYNHLCKYVKFEGIVENSSQQEAFLVYNQLRSAVDLFIKQCSSINYFKQSCFLKRGSSSLSDTNQDIREETEKIFNILQCFGDSLSPRLPPLTNVPLFSFL